MIQLCSNFFGWCKISQILCHMFLFVKKVKYWLYFLDFSVKNHEGVVGELRNSNHIWFMSCTEKHQKITKFSGHPFIVNFTFEIYKYFSLVTWSLLRYLELKLLVTIQLVPNSLEDSLMSKCKGSRVWLMVQVYKNWINFWKVVFSFERTSRQCRAGMFERKRNWPTMVLKYCLSETIDIQENGGRGNHFLQNP